jgi:hypothetical protein
MFDEMLVNEAILESLLEQLASVALEIHCSDQLDSALDILVAAARTLLESDRAIIYRFLPNEVGVILAEAVSNRCNPIQGQQSDDPYFTSEWHSLYQQDRVSSVTDVQSSTLAACHIKLLTHLQVQANLVVPIFLRPTAKNQQSKPDGPLLVAPEPWGLLIAHECSSPREWKPVEIQILQYLAMQLGLAIPHFAGQESWQLHQHLITQPDQQVQQVAELAASKNDLQLDIAHHSNKYLSEFRVLDLMQAPVWIFDIENLQMWWGNCASLSLWNAANRAELVSRNFKDVSESTRIRLQSYLAQFRQGRTLLEQWTFYPYSLSHLSSQKG